MEDFEKQLFMFGSPTVFSDPDVFRSSPSAVPESQGGFGVLCPVDDDVNDIILESFVSRNEGKFFIFFVLILKMRRHWSLQMCHHYLVKKNSFAAVK